MDVTVTTPGGTSAINSGDHYTYGPAITGISPATGSSSGGTTVTITGTDLTGATAVNFGGTAALSYTVNSATSISAVSPVGSVGTVYIHGRRPRRHHPGGGRRLRHLPGIGPDGDRGVAVEQPRHRVGRR